MSWTLERTSPSLPSMSREHLKLLTWLQNYLFNSTFSPQNPAPSTDVDDPQERIPSTAVLHLHGYQESQRTSRRHGPTPHQHLHQGRAEAESTRTCRSFTFDLFCNRVEVNKKESRTLMRGVKIMRRESSLEEVQHCY